MYKSNNLTILGIETSCDDTGIAVLKASEKSGFNVLSNIVSSQVEIHKKYGGVYPTLAKREHQKNLVPVLIKMLKQSRLLKMTKIPAPPKAERPLRPRNEARGSLNSAFSGIERQTLNSILEREPELLKQLLIFFEKYEKPDVDLIAVTQGPGLEPCLWVGINFAKTLSYYWDVPIVLVNHIESHILVNFLDLNSKFENLFPAVCLVVSGGHTQLILMKDIGKYKIIGETRDDAAGECFDKCAKILGLSYPGGPIISDLAKGFKIQNSKLKIDSKFKIQNLKFNISLPRPMFNTNDYDFSFSGLKTAVLYKVKKEKRKAKNKKFIQEMCAEIQQTIIDVLIKKTIKAARDYNIKTIILGGGVSANCELRSQFELKIQKSKFKIQFLAPAKNFCTDNAVMTAITAYFHQKEKIARSNLPTLEAKANLKIE